MTITVVNAPAQPQKVATVFPRRKIHVTVLTAGCTVRVAPERGLLDSPPPFAGTSGLTVLDTTGTVEIEWGGELWALGAAANPANPTVEVDL